MTSHARKRRWMLHLKVLGGVFMLALVITAVWHGINYLRSDDFSRVMAGGSDPVRRVYFETDGVLGESWLNARVDLPEGIELMAVNIGDIQRELNMEGQIDSVLVERVFPDALRIRVTERQPVLRLVVPDASGRKVLRLLSREGVVYAPSGYPAETLRRLPYAHGFTLRRKADGGFERIEGVEPVADFLDQARRLTPEHYASWTTFSLADYDPEGVSSLSRWHVGTEGGCELVFSPEKPGEQLARMVSVLDELESQRRRADRIDLSLDDTVVKLADSSARGPSRFR